MMVVYYRRLKLSKVSKYKPFEEKATLRSLNII